jgi:hypothetical protein
MDSQRKSHLHSFFLRYFHDYREVDKDLFEEQKCDPGDDQLFEGIIRRDFCYWELLNRSSLENRSVDQVAINSFSGDDDG